MSETNSPQSRQDARCAASGETDALWSVIDAAALDARLCEALEIPAAYRVCKCGCDENGHHEKLGCLFTCDCTAFRVAETVYPGLSTTGHGMLLLMQKLDALGVVWGVLNPREGIEAYCLRNEYSACAHAPFAPQALADAAAKAFGIEVPL